MKHFKNFCYLVSAPFLFIGMILAITLGGILVGFEKGFSWLSSEEK